MAGPDPVLLAAAGPVFGYGPAPGMELIPYFLAMLAWIGLAVLGILFSPIRALVRRVRGKRPTEASPPTPGEGPTKSA